MENIVKKMLSIPEDKLVYKKLTNDTLGKKIPELQIEEVLEKSKLCGKNEAEKIKKQFSHFTVKDMIAQSGVRIQYAAFGSDENFTTIGYFETPNRIFINKDIVRGSESLKGIDQMRDYTDVILAHEFFHFIQETTSDLFVNNYKVPLWKFGPIKRSSPLNVLSEIAAASFAKSLCGLSWNPLILDWILLYPKFPEKVEKKVASFL